METWRLLAWTTGLLVLWGTLVSVVGIDVSPLAILMATLFGMVGFHLSQRLVDDRLTETEE